MLLAQPSQKWLDVIEAAMRAGPLATPKIGLFTGNPALTVNTLLADLVPLEPTFAGYSRISPVLGAVRGNIQGDVIDPYASVTFQASGPVAPPQTVTGVFLMATITAVDYLLLAEMLDVPFTFASAVDALDVIYEAYFKNLQVWGGVCVTCP